ARADAPRSADLTVLQPAAAAAVAGVGSTTPRVVHVVTNVHAGAAAAAVLASSARYRAATVAADAVLTSSGALAIGRTARAGRQGVGERGGGASPVAGVEL